MNRVLGKTAVVTGAARGMGAAFAKQLLAEGACVLLTDILDREGEAMANSLGPNAYFLHHDVTKESDWQRVVAFAEGRWGPISVLVNNAGISGYGPIEEMEQSFYRHVVDVCQVSVFLGMKYAIPSMKRFGNGSIINISSMAGVSGFPNALPYVAAKFAVTGMTRGAALELAPFKIRVNSIHPGFIRTPMNEPTPESKAILEQVAATTPIGRIGEPEEVASLVVLLASDESGFTTGAQFVVDGGYVC